MGKNCLLTKLLSKKYYNNEAFKTTMRRVWKLSKPICFHDMGVGFMLLEFEDHSDKSLILIKEFDGHQLIKSIQMNEASF